MSRVYFTPQGGRCNQGGKSGVKKEDEWGTTTSQSEFRGYEAAEMKNCRDGPRHTKVALETQMRGTQPKVKVPPNYIWHRFKESFPDHSASCYTASEQSGASGSKSMPKLSKGQSSDNRGSRPAWADTHNNPIPPHKFDHVTHSFQHNREAQQARHGHYPFRDENAPRSQRLAHDLAEHRCSAVSVASGCTASESAYTMSRSARSRSEASLAPSSHHTADSSRVIGGVAKRRKEFTFRSPGLWPSDREWVQDKLDKEGPVGLTFGNYKPGFYGTNCKQEVEQAIAINALLSGYHEHEVVK